MDLTLARQYLKDRLPPQKAFSDAHLTRALVTGYQRLWRSKPWRFSIKKGQIDTAADYTTGTITTLAALGTAVTFSGTVLDNTFIGRHLRIGSEARDYEITLVGSTTTCTIKDPYESTAISGGSSTFRISKKQYYLPGDYMSGLTFKDTLSGRWLPLVSRMEFERSVQDPNQTSQALWVIEAGFSTAALETTGTAALAVGSTGITGTSTLFDSRMKNLPIYFDGLPYPFLMSTISSTTSVTMDRVWPFDAQSAIKFRAVPAGLPLVELYPVHDEDKSIQIWYHRLPPPLAFGHDVPQWYPEFDDLWIDCTMAHMGMMDEGLVEKRIGDMADRDGITRGGVMQLGSYGQTTPRGGVQTSAASAPVAWWLDD